MGKNIYFSTYVNTNGVKVFPNNIKTNHDYRYSLTIPFIGRDGGPTAVVIMKNPSRAGLFKETIEKMLSDDTVYNVCDYVYKRDEKFSKLIILNLFPVYGPTPKNIKIESLKSAEQKNEEVIRGIIDSLTEQDKIILGWGGYPDGYWKREVYREQIKKVLEIIQDKPTYRVGEELNEGKFPQHGKVWYDFEELLEFKHIRWS
ncbi:DUF1643 domain-containing protein [Paenibacillus sp. S25]|uniref:DUF1643 domain-containing protein n=1 Tax=Paenibacillus sp. S25 TaxID=2823905 RepID=UPI001C6459F6|nr:DUF1643 domain-containing protein [Paenibacillus sp. S25]QYK62567.1 hypothetical protein KAI37_02897 [Paenibacillus sp. S25]